MRHFLPFLLILIAGNIFFISTAYCQVTVSYTYDAAGRRIERNIIVLNSANTDLGDAQTKNAVLTDSLGNQKVLIYPNPTKGELKVEIQGYQKDIKITINLYSLTGKLLQTQNPISNTFSLDLSGYATGTYLLKIVLGDKVSDWKIIKE